MVATELIKPILDRPANLTEMVVEAIQAAIMDKSIPPGSHISEASMAAALSVSKTPVREALLRLRHIGLVVQADRGMRVVTPSPDLIRNAYEMRAGTERLAAQLAAERASEDQLSAIVEAAAESLKRAEAGDREGFRLRDAAFHTQIAISSRNPVLASAVNDIRVLTRAVRARDVPATGDSVVCAHQHISICDALRNGDGETAGRRMYQHVVHVMGTVLAAYADAV